MWSLRGLTRGGRYFGHFAKQEEGIQIVSSLYSTSHVPLKIILIVLK